MTRFGILVVAISAWACGGSSDTVGPATPADSAAILLADFHVIGDPTSTNGATWTYKATTNGVTYDLAGILLKPAGSGPFPGVIISHGSGGNVNAYSLTIARTTVGWGLACIATNYTHSGGGVALGAPGLATEVGASTANVQRAKRVVDILRALSYVDAHRLAAHGHSMGAFVTTALVAAAPTLVLVASHTAGGVRPETSTGPGPAESVASSIIVPYQMHHGDADATVPLSNDQRLATLLTGRGVQNVLYVYAGLGHEDVPYSTTVLDRVRTWYMARGLIP
jgi:dienelactone hydrolase